MYHLILQFKNLDHQWRALFQSEDKIKQIETNVENSREQFDGIAKIFPPPNLVFNAFKFFTPPECRVVIIGQDPYHGIGQAMGLSFSVPEGIRIPPSLLNIFKEMIIDLRFGGSKSSYDEDTNDSNLKQLPNSGDLTHLANQGVLLLNRALTVRESKANSHRNFWQDFTKEIFHNLLEKSENIVVMLWGNDAKDIMKGLDPKVVKRHLILTATHPSPLAANRGGWFGSRHFTKANNYLESKEFEKINWLKN
jgi:uracil-DNA glycosylase